ncbi:hypothetical protein CCHR01_09649 [Colletotrichum chrysophilum]|uniref:Uncharacterized protein n=1 Tax=Colletotrichum chrysophilum TaxID=1836956 RepID=A0AAD9ALI5_9PEZI|nr:hypothetical protein CCHR01_09649 [Colletotrichum chrysophilum]
MNSIGSDDSMKMPTEKISGESVHSGSPLLVSINRRSLKAAYEQGQYCTISFLARSHSLPLPLRSLEAFPSCRLQRARDALLHLLRGVPAQNRSPKET